MAYGLLPGKATGSDGYLGHEVFMAVSDRQCRNERRKYPYGVNDSVCSSTSNVINDKGIGAKPSTSRQHSLLCSGCDRNLKP